MDTFFGFLHIIYQQKKVDWRKEGEKVSERLYNKLILYTNMLQKIGIINEQEKSEMLQMMNKKAL